jgi:hypothetical protein
MMNSIFEDRWITTLRMMLSLHERNEPSWHEPNEFSLACLIDDDSCLGDVFIVVKHMKLVENI